MLGVRDPGDEAMEFIHCPFMVTSPPEPAACRWGGG
jgi:hypothetical protein